METIDQLQLSTNDINMILQNTGTWKWNPYACSFLAPGDEGYGEAKELQKKVEGLVSMAEGKAIVPDPVPNPYEILLAPKPHTIYEYDSLIKIAKENPKETDFLIALEDLSTALGLLKDPPKVVWSSYTQYGVVNQLHELFPEITTVVERPCKHKDSGPINAIVVHLNDSHKWSREKIADWLDTLDVDLTIKPTSQGD